jgi:hypothetical protein
MREKANGTGFVSQSLGNGKQTEESKKTSGTYNLDGQTRGSMQTGKWR